MNILGIVAEYNPFHNGHLYHLERSIEETNADATICVMSGNFVQRGEPALIDKFKRADIAVKNGVDLVIELPLYYSIATAEKFAKGAITLLNHCGVNTLSFGAETNNLDKLKSIARLLLDEPTFYKKELKKELDTGVSFPEARANAVSKVLGINKGLLIQPNNILGIEYLKTIYSLNANIEPHTIERIDSGYHDLDSNTNILSATGIREKLLNNNDIDIFLPSISLESLDNPVFFKNFEEILMYVLRTISLEELKDIPDVTEGLENRIFYAISTSTTVDEIIDKVKTKRYPLTRIKRILLSALLNISKINLDTFESLSGPQYVRILSFNEKGRNLLKNIAATSSIPVVTSVNKFLKDANEIQKEMLLSDILATNIYSIVTKEKVMNLDYLRRLKDV